jgi:hypothetical protein
MEDASEAILVDEEPTGKHGEPAPAPDPEEIFEFSSMSKKNKKSKKLQSWDY